MSSRSSLASLERLYLATRRLPFRCLPNIRDRVTAPSASKALFKLVDQSILGLLIAPNQVANIVAGIGIASGLHLRLHPIFEWIGKGYVHRRHWPPHAVLSVDRGKD